MKKANCWSFRSLLLIAGTIFAASSLYAGENKQSVCIVASGKSEYQILIRNNAPPSWELAAKELQHYLKKVGAVDVPIVQTAKPGQKYIIIGAHPVLPAEKKYNSALYLNERFLIDLTSEGDLVVMGGNESKAPMAVENGNFGVLYGTYELIERYLGVRWYAPGEFGECFEKKNSIQVTGLPFEHQPPFYDRYYWPFIINEATPQESREFYLRLRSGGSKSCLPNHSFQHFVKYTKTNPEVFALTVSGERNLGQLNPKTKRWDVVPQICLSNPKTLELFTNDLDDWYSGSESRKKTWQGPENNLFPSDDFIYVCPNDNYSGEICQCPDCMKKYNKDANFSGTSSLVVFEFIKKVAEWAEKKYPDKKVAFLAYEGYQDLPKNFVFPKNVVVRLCVNPYLMTWGIREYRTRIDQRLTDWKKAVTEVSVWQYYITYDDQPYLTPHIIVDFYRQYAGFLTSVFTQLNNPADDKRPFKINPALPPNAIPCRDFSRAQLDLYFTQKVLWGTPFDVDEELNRYYKLFYGPAAAPMKKHYDLLIKQWENPPASVKALPANIYGGGYSSEDKYGKIYNAAVIKELSESLEQAFKLVEKGSIYERRLVWIKTTYFDDFKKKAEVYQKEAGTRFMALQNSTLGDAPVLDGKMDEKFWEKQPFIQMYDSGGPVPPRYPTKFKCAVQNGILYIGVQANDPDVLNLKRVCKANDIALIFEDDVLEIFAAPNADQPGNYYQIAVNLNQNIFDAQHSNGKGDPKWNSDAKSAGSTGKDSWTMEIALPLKSFGITDLKDEYSLRFNLCRSKCSGTQENRELQQWAPTDRSFHNFNGFGVMSIYSNPRRYENIQTYQKDLIRKIYVNTGLDGVKKTEDQQIQYLLQPTYAKVQIEYNPTKGGTGLGTICFDRFTGLEVGQDDYFEIKFRNPAPGIDCLLGYTLFDVDGTVLGDYYNVTRNNPSPSWNTSAWKIGTGGYSADKAIQEGKPWKAIKKISGVQCYFFATGATTGIDKRDFEIEYIRITKKPLKKIMLKE